MEKKNCGNCEICIKSKNHCVLHDRKVDPNNYCKEHQPMEEEIEAPLVVSDTSVEAKVGRPTKMTQDILRKLENAYLCNATHLEASLYAGISASTLHDYRSKNPEFSERIKAIRGMTGLKAKMNIVKAIKDGNLKISKWYVSRYGEIFDPQDEPTHPNNKETTDERV